jgi:DMSO/TMAO reductase YedYZ molybdopterin-dependent catalytic subunit
MKILRLFYGGLVGLLVTAPLLALLYLGASLLGLPFVPFELFNWITRLLPGPVITWGIDRMLDVLLFLGVDVADTAKAAEQAMALAAFLALGLVVGLIVYSLYQRLTARPSLVGLLAGGLIGLPMVAIAVAAGSSDLSPAVTAVGLFALFLLWGLALTLPARRLLAEVEPPVEISPEFMDVQRISRRQFLVMLGAASASITVVGAGLAAVLNRPARSEPEDSLVEGPVAEGTTAPEPTPESPFPNAGDPVKPAPGTRPEYTPLEDHYKVFIELEPTAIEGEGYQLPITGLVDNPLSLSVDEISANYPVREQYVTLNCISGRIGTTLIGTTLWTGASLQEVLADAQVRPEARYLHITSGDGFYETIDLELIEADERIMLCYAWDGKPIPSDHGFPLRVWIPDRYGMKQPKWITGMEVTEDFRPGYWVQRGWDLVAQVQTTSVVDTVAVAAIYEEGGQRLVPVGGIAFSGARGISKVEVRVDNGPWQAAQLRAPLSESTWVIWRYDWPFSEGDHVFEVRCVEGDGTAQIEEERSSRPAGATGLHSREIFIQQG